MYIIERKQVVQAYPYNPEHPYKYDRTFYVCCSQRVDGKPKRITLGYFKNAESIQQAIDNQTKELINLTTTGRSQYIGFFGEESWTNYKKEMESQLTKLNDWLVLLPEWKAEPSKDVPYSECKKYKPRKPRMSLVVKKANNLWLNMNDEEKNEFMLVNNLQRKSETC